MKLSPFYLHIIEIRVFDAKRSVLKHVVDEAMDEAHLYVMQETIYAYDKSKAWRDFPISIGKNLFQNFKCIFI